MNCIGLKIKKVREIKNLSQCYVAKKLCISQAAYSSIENGKTKIPETKLKLIATIFGVKPETITNFNEHIILNYFSESEEVSKNTIEKIQELYEKLVNEKESRIKELENELKKHKSF